MNTIMNTTSTLSLTEQNNAIITEAVNAVLSEAIEHFLSNITFNEAKRWFENSKYNTHNTLHTDITNNKEEN